MGASTVVDGATAREQGEPHPSIARDGDLKAGTEAGRMETLAAAIGNRSFARAISASSAADGQEGAGWGRHAGAVAPRGEAAAAFRGETGTLRVAACARRLSRAPSESESGMAVSRHFDRRTVARSEVPVRDLTEGARRALAATFGGAGGQAETLAGGGVRFAVAPADRSEKAAPARAGQRQLARTRVPLPRNIPMCGKTLTHIEVHPPRWRDLEPCKPKGLPVYRINIIGRDTTTGTSPAGSQVFNLHVGYYVDPATGRYCGIVDDSKRCICGRCIELGCFPTLREVLDAIMEFLKKALVVVGIIALAILIALILEALAPILVPAFAEAGEAGDDLGPEPERETDDEATALA